MGRRFIIGALMCAGCFSTALSTKASVTVLTGGDPADGWIPRTNDYVLAGNVLHLGTLTPSTSTPVVQTIPFLAMDDPSFPTNRAYVTGAYGQNWSLYPSFGSSANDDELERILHTGMYPAGSFTLHLEQLAPAHLYRVDLFAFTYNTGVSHPTSFIFNGQITNSFTEVPNTPYLVSEWVEADGSGNITVKVTQDLLNGFSQPMLNGFALFIPEPSTVALLGLGGLLMISRRR